MPSDCSISSDEGSCLTPQRPTAKMGNRRKTTPRPSQNRHPLRSDLQPVRGADQILICDRVRSINRLRALCWNTAPHSSARSTIRKVPLILVGGCQTLEGIRRTRADPAHRAVVRDNNTYQEPMPRSALKLTETLRFPIPWSEPAYNLRRAVLIMTKSGNRLCSACRGLRW